MRKIITLLTYFLASNFIILAQNSISDLARYEMYYWKLRGRLTGDENNRDVYNGFMQVGSGVGKSIPGAIRFPTYNRGYWRFNYVNPQIGTVAECYHQYLNGIRTGSDNNSGQLLDPRDGQDLKGIMYWNDNPLITHGNYLAVLGTEWCIAVRV